VTLNHEFHGVYLAAERLHFRGRPFPATLSVGSAHNEHTTCRADNTTEGRSPMGSPAHLPIPEKPDSQLIVRRREFQQTGGASDRLRVSTEEGTIVLSTKRFLR
jgi:hypothetical protein